MPVSETSIRACIHMPKHDPHSASSNYLGVDEICCNRLSVALAYCPCDPQEVKVSVAATVQINRVSVYRCQMKLLTWLGKPEKRIEKSTYVVAR